MNATLWHYTTGLHAERIFLSGVIATTAVGCPDQERPVAWFSSNQFFEPTALKAVVSAQTGVIRSLDLRGQHELGGGTYRFGTHDPEAVGLIPWPTLAAKARISGRMRQELEHEGRRVGADPADWWGSLKPVPISKLIWQRLTPDLVSWISACEAEAA